MGERNVSKKTGIQCVMQYIQFDMLYKDEIHRQNNWMCYVTTELWAAWINVSTSSVLTSIIHTSKILLNYKYTSGRRLGKSPRIMALKTRNGSEILFLDSFFLST